jgi:uncharacterized membrane protein
MMDTIRNPVDWGLDQVRLGASAVASIGRALGDADRGLFTVAPRVRRIDLGDVGDALARGVADFMACRTDVVFLCVVYPAAGLALASLAFNSGLLPLLFPLASGFALVGPFAGIGLYELSRRREETAAVTFPDAFGFVRSPAFGRIVVLGAVLVAMLLLWLGTALGLYDLTLGPKPPVSAAAFLRDVLTTNAGWTLIIVGCGVGFLFACVVLAVGVVSFPMLVDRDVSLGVAVRTSIRAVADNPEAMAAWGLIVAASLVVGTIPCLLGLIFVMPVLGHATWHLYRRLVPR